MLPRAVFLAEVGALAAPSIRRQECGSEEDGLETWQEVAGLDAATFERRLAAAGLDRGAAATLLARVDSLPESAALPGPVQELAGDAPGWLRTLASVFDSWEGRHELPALTSGVGFEPALSRFVAWAEERLEGSVPPAPGSLRFDWPALRPGLHRFLAARLHTLCQRVLVLELNVARLENRLSGNSPDDRFRSYRELLSRPGEWRRLFGEYQLLARLTAVTLERWVEAAAELFQRLVDDWPALRRGWVGGAREAVLTEARGGLSDPHRGGRATWILTFELRPRKRGAAAAELRLVYKPKPLAVDRHFQRLLSWCNRRAEAGDLNLEGLALAEPRRLPPAFPPLRTVRILDRGSYGWTEHLEARPCSSREELARFFVRQGGLLALVWALDGTDLHHENLIACGEDPVLVDLETLFHHRLGEEAEASAATRALLRLDRSVLAPGLLPQWVRGGDEDAAVNLGGLGDAAPQPSPWPSPGWEAAGTDRMRQVLRPGEIAPGAGRPTLRGEAVSASDHVEEVVAGFESMARLLTGRGRDLARSGGPLAGFARDDVRHVFRPTHDYAALLWDGTHPDFLRAGVHRDQLLDLLWAWSRGDGRLEGLIPAEQEALRLGDVPLFTSRPGSRDLRDGRGRVWAGFFPEASLDRARRRLDRLADEDLEWQAWVIRAALGTTVGHQPPPAPPTPEPTPRRRGPRATPSPLREAERIGERLLCTAVLGDRGDATWIGMTYGGDGRWQLGPVGGDLYGGDAGIALFLAYLARLSGREEFDAMARRAAVSLRSDLGSAAPRGGFTGLPSRLYALTHLARLWRDPDLSAGLEDHLARLRSSLDDVSAPCDLLQGAAGTAAALLTVHRATGNGEALDLAVACGRHLVAAARPTAAGRAWRRPGDPEPLLGFAHGTAGIAWLLAELARALDDRPGGASEGAAFRRLARQAVAHERSLLDRSRGNWPDYRPTAGPARGGDRFSTAWCYGAPGVALGRILMLDLLEEGAEEEIEIAVETTLASGLGFNHCLCHGDLGNLAVVDRAARVLGREDWSRQVSRHLDRVTREVAARGPRCGVHLELVVPGLLPGLAGIGYGLLALEHPGHLPLLLALEPPPETVRRARARRLGPSPVARRRGRAEDP